MKSFHRLRLILIRSNWEGRTLRGQSLSLRPFLSSGFLDISPRAGSEDPWEKPDLCVNPISPQIWQLTIPYHLSALLPLWHSSQFPSHLNTCTPPKLCSFLAVLGVRAPRRHTGEFSAETGRAKRRWDGEQRAVGMWDVTFDGDECESVSACVSLWNVWIKGHVCFRMADETFQSFTN